MSDLVRRLRKWAARWPEELNTAALVTEAAGRIEELEVALKKAISIIGEYEPACAAHAYKTYFPEVTKKD